ncbi:hypothetical protein [Nitrosopumilus sp.]|uniref:hypothetical protein n=1 Tax=Nitrosopumilus sp. TaxID=2024843 RepID=UPI003D12B9CD
MIIEKHPLPEMEPFYQDVERQFLEFNEIIPVGKNPIDEIYSPRFFNMIHTLGAQVDTMLQILLKDLGIKPKTKNFPEYYNALNCDGMLAYQKVKCKLDHSTIQPFKEPSPEWWNKYNKAKHELPFGIETIRLRHILESLAGLYVLNNLAWTREIATDMSIDLPDYYRYSNTFLDIKSWRDEEYEREHDLHTDNNDTIMIKSKIFSRLTYYYPKSS